MERILAAAQPDTVLVTIPQAPADRLDAVVRACAAADVPCRFVRRETDLDPVAVLGAARAALVTAALRRTLRDRRRSCSTASTERDPGRRRLPLAVRALRLADPRARDAVALHRRAEATRRSRGSIAETGHAASRGTTRPPSTRSTPTSSRRSGGSTTSTTAYAAIKYFGVIVIMTSAIFPTYFLARMVVSRALGALRRGRRGRDPGARLRAVHRSRSRSPIRGRALCLLADRQGRSPSARAGGCIGAAVAAAVRSGRPRASSRS